MDNRNKYKLKIKQKKAQAKKELLPKVVNNLQNWKVFWSEIRALTRPTTVQTNVDSEQWLEHFKGVFISECATEAYEGTGSDDFINDDELDAPICAQEVDEAIDSLKPRKAAGVDGS